MVSRPIVQLVCNPDAGGYSSRRIDGLRAAWAAHGFDTLVCESSPRNGFTLVGDVARICIAGGDGTVRHVLTDPALRNAGKPVDIFPAGTINLAAREWRTSRQPGRFVKRAIRREPRPVYPGTVNGTAFLVCASIGPDARAVANVSLALKKHIGRLAYGASMIRSWLNWQRPQLTVEVDGEMVTCEAVYIAKGRFYAGPWSFAPDARLDSPLLHVVALRRARRRDYLAFVLAIVLGRPSAMANICCLQGRNVCVESDQEELVQVDGDIAASLPARFQVSGAPILA
jgi:diacylglycerol kinase family enzyme